MTDVWTLVHAERAALLADLQRLAESQWDEPSLCAGWTVHDVAAHLVDTARTTRLGFLVGLARARFDFDHQNAQGVRRWRGATPRDTLDALRAAAPRTTTPPAPLDSRLVEEVVHGEDIRRPLGLVRAYPTQAVVRGLLLQARTTAAFGGAKEIVRHVRLTASDADVSVGQGPVVEGPALSLLLATSGRTVALGDLAGPGTALLGDSLGGGAPARRRDESGG